MSDEKQAERGDCHYAHPTLSPIQPQNHWWGQQPRYNNTTISGERRA